MFKSAFLYFLKRRGRDVEGVWSGPLGFEWDGLSRLEPGMSLGRPQPGKPQLHGDWAVEATGEVSREQDTSNE